MRLVAGAAPEFGVSNLRLQGGTALAAFHLHHRESEDLDFFADAPLDARPWGEFVRHVAADAGIELIAEGVPNVGMARYLAVDPDDPERRVKIDLVQESPFKLAPLEETAEGIRIASYRDLCASKLGAVCGRWEVRDILDLHVILNPVEDVLGTEQEIARDFNSLMADLMESDPGITPHYVGRGISRGMDRAIVSVFPLAVFRQIEEQEIQRTLRICLAECARQIGDALPD